MKIDMTLDLSNGKAEDLLKAIEYDAAEKVARGIYGQADIKKVVKETIELINKERANTLNAITFSADKVFRNDFIQEIVDRIVGRVSSAIMGDKQFIEVLSDAIVEKLQKEEKTA